MAHKITVQANGMTFTLETSADVFTIGGVVFDLNVPRDPVGHGTQVPTNRARFSMAQVAVNKIACIKAVREATGRDLREAKELVESGGIFEITPFRREAFDRMVREHNLTVIWV